jgi:chromosome segregation ATPase
MDAVGALESARQRALEEVKGLREEVGMLNSLVKEKENYIQRIEGSGGAWLASPEGKKQKTMTTRTRVAAAPAAAAAAPAAAVIGGGGAGMQQLLEQVHKLERALRHATKREKTLKERLEGVEEERKGLKEAGARLEEENGKLKMELKGTAGDHVM